MTPATINFNGHEIGKDAEGRLSLTDELANYQRSPEGFTGLAALKNGMVLVDDIIPAEAWAYFCEHVLFAGNPEKPGLGLAGVFAMGIQAHKDLQYQAHRRASVAGYVYFMADLRNGLFKIGVSREPEEREATLQAEQPAIKLLYKIRLENRPDMYRVELLLHQRFAECRQRGEWFMLTADQYTEALEIGHAKADELNASLR